MPRAVLLLSFVVSLLCVRGVDSVNKHINGVKKSHAPFRGECCELPNIGENIEKFPSVYDPDGCKLLCPSSRRRRLREPFSIQLVAAPKSGSSASFLMFQTALLLAAQRANYTILHQNTTLSFSLSDLPLSYNLISKRHWKASLSHSQRTLSIDFGAPQHRLKRKRKKNNFLVMPLRSAAGRLVSAIHFQHANSHHNSSQPFHIPVNYCRPEAGATSRCVDGPMGLAEQASLTFSVFSARTSIAGLFAYTFEELWESPLSLTMGFVRWLRFSPSHVKALESDFAEALRPLMRHNMSSHSPHLKHKYTNFADRIHLRVTNRSTLDADQRTQLSPFDIQYINHYTCQSNPFLSALFHVPGEPKCNVSTMAERRVQ